MKKTLQITMKNKGSVTIEATVKKTNDTFIKVFELQETTSPLFLEIKNQQIISLLELCKVSPYVLLYFDEELNFSGASYSLNGNESSFGISTEAKKILLLHYPISFQLKEVFCLTFIS